MCKQCNHSFHTYARLRREIIAGPNSFEHIWLYDYGDIRELIIRSKYKREFAHLRHLSSHCAQALLHSYTEDFSLVTSIPTNISHIRVRGYDHSSYFASCLARKLSRPYRATLSQAYPFRQTSHSRQDRLQTPRFITMSNVAGAHILLIDDIASTRGSLRGAVHTLMQSGAHSVTAFTLAYNDFSSKIFWTETRKTRKVDVGAI